MKKVALLDDNNVVINFIVAEDSYEPEEKFVLVPDGVGCGVGFTYHEGRGFAPPQPYPSWQFNSEFLDWFAPVDAPLDGYIYFWDETTLSWIKGE